MELNYLMQLDKLVIFITLKIVIKKGLLLSNESKFYIG